MNRRNENYGQSGNNNGGQPDRYPQQEWSDDDYRGGNRYRVNQPYASGEDQDESPRGSRFLELENSMSRAPDSRW